MQGATRGVIQMAGLSGSTIKLIAAMFAGTSVAAVGGGYLIKDDAVKPVIQGLLSGQPESGSMKEAPKTKRRSRCAAGRNRNRPTHRHRTGGRKAGYYRDLIFYGSSGMALLLWPDALQPIAKSKLLRMAKFLPAGSQDRQVISRLCLIHRSPPAVMN